MSAALLDQWANDGTLARLDTARVNRTPVRIKRSSGEFVTGIIAGWGHGGLSHVVAWGDGVERVWWNVGADRVEIPDGVFGKRVDTVDLIEWNPWLGAPQTTPWAVPEIVSDL